jgi:hypothetical protein
VTRRTGWMAVVPLFGVVACADVWGFSDLTGGDAVAPDATTPQGAIDAPGAGMDSSAPDSAQSGDESSGELPDSREQREVSEAGDGGMTVREGGPGDGGNDAAVAACKAICPMGCCDSTGHCVTALSARACGAAGAQCVDCTTTAATCTPLTPACCGSTTGQCGCSLATVGCSKN